MRTHCGLVILVLTAVLGTLALATEAGAQVLCFTTAPSGTGTDFRVEVMTIGPTSASLSGGLNGHFFGAPYSASVSGSAYMRPGGTVRMGLTSPAGGLTVLFDLLLNPPAFTSGTGTLVFVPSTTLPPQPIGNLTISPLATCPVLN